MLCKEHAVPINYSVYKEITSPMGKDLYAWIVYRNNFLTEDKPIFIPKKSLVDQFNPVEKDVKDISYSEEGLISLLIKDNGEYSQSIKIPTNVYNVNQILCAGR